MMRAIRNMMKLDWSQMALRAFAPAMIASLAFFGTACEGDEPYEGEEVGEQIGENLEERGEALEEAGEELEGERGEMMEERGEALQEMAD